MTRPLNKVGKLVGGRLYAHRDALPCLDRTIRAIVAQAARIVGTNRWNVVKVCKREVSLLWYESFDVPFPALLGSYTVDLDTAAYRYTNFRDRDNPPILHRKELLLHPRDPRVPSFAALTRAAEEHGLFVETRSIGTRQRWEQRIKAAGLKLDGHQLVSFTA